MTPRNSRSFSPLRQIPPEAKYKAGDVLVVFGELFSRGYANGIVDEAIRAGMKVVRSTVGRRESDGQLRALNAEEFAAQPQPFINIPLEAGFDMEPCSQDGTSPVDQIKHVKMGEWAEAKLDWAKVEDSRRKATERFRQHVQNYMLELEKHIPKGANVLFAHTMAGGVPRAKILMPTMNRVFKGTGDRHLSSETFWQSELGKLCSSNFDDVTALTLRHLIELSTPLRERLSKEGGSTRYVAYGYHGNEVLIRGEYKWQSYAPYLQGWAKILLEDVASQEWKRGVHVAVYNCPEILTNSSSIFVGIEVPLYPFLSALKKEIGQTPRALSILSRAKALLNSDFDFEKIEAFTDEVLTSRELLSVCHFETWPEHNSKSQMEKLIHSSEKLVAMHRDPKQLITFLLSEEIFRATGYIMFHDSFVPSAPVYWLGHDVIAKTLGTEKTL